MSLINILWISLILVVSCVQGAYTIILDPSDAPRQLATSFAKGATLQCAESIKKYLEQNESIQVIITRTPGAHSSHENHAQMSNRLKANVYIHISFFQDLSLKPHWYIYHHSYGNETQDFINQQTVFCPYELAHCYAQKQTIQYADTLYASLHTHISSLYQITPALAVPCATLIGITAPAVMFDIGLHAAHTWQQCVVPLCQAIETLVQTYICP